MILDDLYNHHEKGRQTPNSREMVKALGRVVNVLPYAYLIFDALDECPEREEVLDFMKTVSEWKVGKLKVLVTSRPLSDIEDALDSAGARRIPLQSHVVDGDIKTYVTSRILADKQLQQHSNAHAEIETRLIEGAAGMYGAARQISSRLRVVVRKQIRLMPSLCFQVPVG